MGQVYDNEPGDPMDQKWSPDLASPAERVEVVRRAGAWSSAGIASAISPAGARGGCAARFGLLLVCMLAFVPGFFALPPVDRDESRFAQASRQMFESVALPPSLRDPERHRGGLLIPMVQDRERLNKPPLIYWLQAGSAAVLTLGRPHADRIWMYRIPSLIAGIAVVLLTWRLGWLLFDARTGAVAGALVAVSPVFAWEAHQARADMVLVAWTVLAQAMLWRIFRGERPALQDAEPRAAAKTAAPGHLDTRPSLKYALWFWIAIAAGVMTKGPITPMVIAFTALGLGLAYRRFRWMLELRPVIGVLIVFACVAPWVFGVARQVGWDVYIATITDEVLGRSLAPKEGHWGPPGYHTLLLPILFWPGSLLTAAAIGLAWRGIFGPGGGAGALSRLRARLANVQTAEPAYIFLLAWIIPAWIIFEFVSTKLPHYTMPLVPAIAILSAHAVFAAEAGLLPRIRERLGRAGLTLWLLIGGIFIGLGLSALALLIARSSFVGGVFFLFIAVAFAGVAIVNMRQVVRSWTLGRYARAQLASVLVALAIIIVVIGLAIPRLIELSPAIVRAIDTIDPSGARPVALVRYHEDSMIFLTRGRAQRIAEESLDDWFAMHPAGLAIIPHGLEDERAGRYRPIASFSGFNYAKGRTEHLMLIEGIEP
jgi:4-amino-4-deoxy-L-arabinose transferase-like glycosyltransferase